MLAPLLLFSLLSAGTADVEVIPIQHASLILQWQGKAIYVDPTRQGDYTGRPQADLILITDIHGDHLDPKQIEEVSGPQTKIVAPAAVQKTVPSAQVLDNGESTEVLGVGIEAVPMYNLKRGPDSGGVYHPKGRGNGYVLTLGSTRVYISGDTECTPEMKALKDIDLAFVSMNLPYTMPPEEAAECINRFQPKVVYPYHYRGSDLEVLKRTVKEPVEVKIVDWY